MRSRPPSGPRARRPDRGETSPRSSAPERDGEEKVYGLTACQRVFERRPQDIVRAYVREDVLPKVRELLRYCAAERRAYHVVHDKDLSRVTSSVHHEGLCLLVRRPRTLDFEALCTQLAASHEPCSLLYLDGVENPHNVGAILRSCGHFGVSTLLGEAGRLPALSAAAQRVAMGAAESVKMVYVNGPGPALQRLRALGFELVATLATGAPSLFDVVLPRRIVWLIGAEGPGLSPTLQSLATSAVTIPGTGEVESLNVSVACAVLMAEHWRQRRAPAAPDGTFPLAEYSRADHSRAEHTRAEHSRAEHSRAEHSRAEHSRAEQKKANSLMVIKQRKAPKSLSSVNDARGAHPFAPGVRGRPGPRRR